MRRKNDFEIPDFLIVAHALDGYFKRFVNKKDGKDNQKYEDGIKKLLKQFKNVDTIKRCNIDAKILAETRDYYSHLYPEEERKNVIEGRDLLWLTKKCQVLLTCCILDLMGLGNDEINICCNNSPITNMMDASPFEFREE